MRKALVRRGGQIIEVDVDDNYVNQLHKAQVGEQVYKPVYDEWDNEIMSSKHRTRGGRDFTKYRKYDPEIGREYIEKEWFNPKTNTIRYSTREKGRLFPEIVNRYATEPNPFIPVDEYYNPYSSDFNSQPTLLPGMQMGDEVKGTKYDEYGNIIVSSKHKIKRGKDFTKYVVRDPESGYTYINKETFDPETNTINYSTRGRNKLFPNRMSYEAMAPNPFIPIDRYNNPYDPQFNSQPTFQMGGAPQEQMAQQQMPPQQEGQGSEQDQIMQLIQAYAQAMGISPEEIMQQLQQMDPQAQQQAIQQMAQELQGAQQQAPQQEMPPEQMMQRGGNSKGADIVEMSTPEYKNDYFAKLTQKFGQNNYDKAFMKDMNNEFQKFQSGGYIQNADGTQSYDLGSRFDPNRLAKANVFQDDANNKKKDGNTFEAFANVIKTGADTVGQVAKTVVDVGKKVAPIVANVVAPGSGVLLKAGMSAMDKSKGAGSGPVDSPLGGAGGGAGGGFDPSQLISMFAKFGGNLPRFQNTGQFNSGIGSFADSPAWNFDNTGLDTFMTDFELKNQSYGKQTTPAPVANITMADQSKNTPDVFGPQDDPITTNATNPNKDKELVAGPDSVKKPNFSMQEMGATRGMGPAVAGLFEAMGNKGKAKQAEAFAQNAFGSDNLFTANTSDRIIRGDYVTNTQPNNANFRPDDNIPMGPFGSRITKYGAQIAKVGVQVQNPYLSNPNSHPEAILYGEPDPKVSNTLKPVKREQANLEAEVGEVAVTPAGPDGVPKFFKIGGKNHYEGGTPLNLPENTFIFSKTRSMIIKDPKILKELTGSTKPATPADLAKKFDYSEYIATIQNENSDPVERKTAQFMIENMMYKLGQIAIIQEAKKGFPNGIPLVAVPYLEKAGIAPESILPQMQQEQPPMDPGMQQQMDPAMQQQMMQQPQEQMDPRMMQEQMQQVPEEMMMPPMARYGGTNIMGGPVIPAYQTGSQVKKNPAQAIISSMQGRSKPEKSKYAANPMKPLEGLVGKGFSGDMEYEEEFKIKYPIAYNAYRMALSDPTPTNVENAKNLLQQGLQGTGILGWDMLSRSMTDKFEDLQDILDAEVEYKTVMKDAAKKLNVVKNTFSQLDQEKKKLWQNLNSDKAKTDAGYASALQKQYQDLNDLFNKNKYTLSALESNYKDGFNENNYFSRNLPNIDLLGYNDIANSFINTVSNYRKSYPTPIETLNTSSTTEEPVASKTTISADSTAKSTPTPVEVQTPVKTKTTTQTPKQTSNSTTSKSKKIITFGPNDLNNIKIIQQP